MAPIVNPYLKKNQEPRVGNSSTAGGEGVTTSQRSNGRAPHVANNAPRSDVTATAAAKEQPLPPTKPPSAGIAPGASKSVTPGKNTSTSLYARATTTTPRPKLVGVPSHVTPGSSYVKSLKQKLKQEIQFLKLKKHNAKAQKEAEERRRKIQAEKDQVERQRQAKMAAQEKERLKAAADAQAKQQRHQVQLLRVQQQQQHQNQPQAEPVAIEPQRQIVKEEKMAEKKNPMELERRQEERVQRLLCEKQQQQVWHAKKEEHQKAKMQHELAVRAWREQQLLIQQQQSPMYGLPQQNGIVPSSNPSYNNPLSAALYDSFRGRFNGATTGGFPLWNQNQYHHPYSFATHFGPALGVANYGSGALMGSSSHQPPPPPPMPVVPRIQQQSRPQGNIESSMGPILLCSPLDHPSPFAHEERRLLTVPVVRHPENEPSFGVNLNLQKISTLVDPDWFWEERQRRLKMQQSQEDEPKEEHSNADLLPTVQPSSSLSETTDQAPTRKDNEPLSEDMTTHTPHQAKPDSIARVPTNLPLPEASVGDETIEQSESRRLTMQGVSDVTFGPKSTVTELKTTIKQESINSAASLKNLKNLVAEASVTLVSTTPVARRRRRRMDFAVMVVAGAEKQNARQPHATKEEKLEPGDIIISIGGQKIADLTFQDACSLFAKKIKKVESSGMLEVQVVVARKKPVPSATHSIESLSKSSAFADPPLHRPVNTSMDFTPTEMAFLAECVHKWLDDPCRALGRDLDGAELYRHSHIFRLSQSTANNPSSSISHRSVNTLQIKWSEMARLTDHKLVESAKAFWTKTMTDEYSKLALENLPFATEAELIAMRHLRRPVKGCRCMREDHEYVFDPNCLLYHDLRSRLSASELEEVLSLPNRAQKGKSSVAVPDDLNAVESAYTNRVLKLKHATENEEAEARFVARMEFMQVKELKKAIFAPCLSAVVLSTIFELQREFPPLANRGTDNHGRNEEEDDDDEEDDMPLVSLGKRKSSAKHGQSNKRRTPNNDCSPKFSFQYLTRMLHYISKTWGHCYREPSHEDYTWRWEVFHGNFSQSSDQRSESSPPTNPRKPDSLPFENVRFGLVGHDGVHTSVAALPAILNANQVAVSRQLETQPVEPILPVPSSNGSVPTGATASVGRKEGDAVAVTIPPLDVTSDVLNQYCTTIHLLSPARTGLYDELLALLKMEVIESKNGIPTLTQDWWSKIDNILLEDMDENWSTEVDPDGKFRIHDELRDTLEEQWVKSEFGWSMAEDRKTLIFEFAVLDEWRQSFEGQQEEKAKRKDGIGLFGL